MIDHYVLLDGNRIAGKFHGPVPDSPTPEGLTVRVLPEDFSSFGEDIREYDDRGNLRPLAARIKEGLVVLEPHEKINGEAIVPKTNAELVRDGVFPRPKGWLVDTDDDGSAVLRQACILEQVKLGDMTQKTADTINAVNVRAQRDALLAGCDWTQAADAQLKDDTKAEWKAYRQALRDITEQGSFPSGEIAWPIRPDGVSS